MTERVGFIVALIGAVLAALLPAGCGGTGPSAPGRDANVVLIVVDTLRADHLGVYGFERETSPRIDELAREGVRFERFTTVAPSTLASFTSLLTSRHPHTHGVYRNGVAWPDGLTGVQSVFGDAGYETAAFVASFCLTSPFGLSRGFDHFGESLTESVDAMPQNKLIRRGADVTDEAIAWLDARPEDAPPFFAMVHYFDPHWPYAPPADYIAMFAEEYDGPMTGSVDDVHRVREQLAAAGGRPTPDSRHLYARHLGEIRYTDDQVGRLLEALGRRGLDDETLVVLTADHGETFHEHEDYFDHGASVFDTAIRVPLIVRGPGVEGGGRTEPSPRSTIDLAPTLLEHVGLASPPGFEGRSFAARLWAANAADDPVEPRPLFAEATKPDDVEAGQSWPNRLKARCVSSGRYKLIHTPWLGNRRQLFDLRDDPGETRDLWGTAWAQAADADGLDRLLGAWSLLEPAGEQPTLTEDEEALERLRSLGYVQ